VAELEALRDIHDDIRAAGAQLVAISPMVERHARKTAEDLQLDFPLLIDAGHKVAQSYGLVWSLPEDLCEVYKGFGIDLARFHGADDWRLAMPACYIIAQNSTIVSADISVDHTDRPEPEETLERLRRHLAG